MANPGVLATLLPQHEAVTMPRMHVCSQPGCPTLTTTRRCPDHTRATEQRRGTRQARGYDAQHDRLREWWKPKVEQGQVDCHAVVCLMHTRRIYLGMEWHLDHDDDRTGYRGPAHALCNVSAGGKAAHGDVSGS